MLAGIGTLGLLAVSPAAAASDIMPIAISSYFDTAHNTNQVFFMDAYGAIDAHSWADGISRAWSCTRQLPACTVVYQGGTPIGCTSLNTAEFAPGGNLVATFDGSLGHLYYIGNDATLWEAWGNPPSSATSHSLTAVSGASTTPWSEWSTYSSSSIAGGTIPGLNPAATLAGYDIAPADQHVFFRALSDDLVHETYYNGTWHDRALPATPNISNAFSGSQETAYYDGYVGHVFFVDQSQTFNEFYYYNGTWWNGLTGNGPGFPNLFIVAMASSVGGIPHQAIYGSSSTTGEIAEAYFTDVNFVGRWTESTFTPPGGQVYDSPMVTFSSPSQDYLLYIGSDNNVYSTAVAGAINVSSGAPAVAISGTPVHQSPLTGYWEPHLGYGFAFYVGQDSHVHQLYATSAAGPWYHTDMTANSGCYPAAH